MPNASRAAGLAQHAAKAGAFFGHHGGDLGQLVLFIRRLVSISEDRGLAASFWPGLAHAVAFGGRQRG